jgi:hypothetical protein
MALTHKIIQQRAGTNHSAVFIEDNFVSQKRIGVAVYDPVRSQFAFSLADHDIVLSAADQSAILAILNSLQR